VWKKKNDLRSIAGPAGLNKQPVVRGGSKNSWATALKEKGASINHQCKKMF
jgi:hypothetical protein